MRILIALLALSALLVSSADARRPATKSEKRAISQFFNAPPKCAKIFVSTVDERWASYRFNANKIDVSPCDQVAADGTAVLRKRRGEWRFVTSGSSFDCPVPDTPRKVAKDLRIPCT